MQFPLLRTPTKKLSHFESQKLRRIFDHSKLLIITVIAALVVGCGGDAEQSRSDVSVASPDAGASETSLANDVMPLIAQTCGGCHTRNNAPFPPAIANDVYYDSKDDILALVGSFIIAGDSSQSGFVSILTQDLAVGQGPTLMPPPPTDGMAMADIAVVQAWIDEGAKDN